MSEADPGVQQCPVERPAATQQKANEFVTPVVGDVLDVSNAAALLPDLVHSQIRPDVGVLGHVLETWLAGVGDLQHGAGLRVALAEDEKIEGLILRDDDEVGLHIALCQSDSVFVESSFPYYGTDLARMSPLQVFSIHSKRPFFERSGVTPSLDQCATISAINPALPGVSTPASASAHSNQLGVQPRLDSILTVRIGMGGMACSTHVEL